MEGHWSCTCSTPKHLINLYQAPIKENEKGFEMNFANHNDLGVNKTHLDMSLMENLII